jgi:predicted TIM-barrel fold metal-dependent hydrolase
MQIVDAQVHIWSSGTPIAHHRQVFVYDKDELLRDMREAGVDAAVLHPPSWDPNSNEVAIEAARRHPDKFAILGHFPLDKAENRKLIDTWKSQPGMLGLRYALVRPEQQNWHADGTMDWLWPEAERAGLPVALLANRFFPLVAQIAERHPRLRLIMDHLGVTRGGMDDAAFSKNDELCALARFPNIAVKATGAPGYSTQPYPYRNIHDHMRRIFDAFGPARFFWGTDITRMPCSYRQCVTMFTEELPWLRGRDLDLVMGQGVCDWIGWQRKVA